MSHVVQLAPGAHLLAEPYRTRNEREEDEPASDMPEALGWRGELLASHHTDFTLTRETACQELDAYAEAHNTPDWVIYGWVMELAHIGQVGTVVAAWHGGGSFPDCVRLRFDDGWRGSFWVTEVAFD